MRWHVQFSFFLGAITLVAVVSHLPAQEAPPVANTRQQKISVRTGLVLVPVIVTDKSGKPVSGLTKDAFHLEENGKSRSLSFFEETQTQKLTAFPSGSSPATTSANFLPHDDRLRLTIVLLDMLNTPWLRQVEAKKQLIDYLLRLTSQGEPIALFALNSSGLHQIHPLTTDTKVLVLALQKLKLSLSSEESTQPPATLTDDPTIDGQSTLEEQLLSDMLQDLNDTVAANYQRMATRQTLSAMTQFAHALRSFPGRKTLIWATAGFPFTIDDPDAFARQGDDLRPEYEEAWRSLNSSNIAVYPVDLGSADFPTKALPSSNATVSKTQINTIRGGGGGALRSSVNLPYDQGVQQRLTMHSFADATGGRACITISALEKCFAEAVDDSRAYYLLGYYLGEDTQPGWRKLRVKVSRESLHVRSRTGFYVGPRVADTPEQRRQELVDALASVVQYTGLHLTARLETEDSASPSAASQPTSGAGQTRSVAFQLGIMGDTLTVDRERNNAIDLQIASLAFDSKRKSVASSSQAVATTLKPELLQKILQTGLGIAQKLDLPPGKYEIKFAVRDNLTGSIGTVSLFLDLR
ncbi:MAG TPA: VWA domain-containing protein [Candidatus Acidoferrum sp.]|nr:VWA domain-containing protein [Candidatus Acidoferrum sp.]